MLLQIRVVNLSVVHLSHEFLLRKTANYFTLGVNLLSNYMVRRRPYYAMVAIIPFSQVISSVTHLEVSRLGTDKLNNIIATRSHTTVKDSMISFFSKLILRN